MPLDPAPSAWVIIPAYNEAAVIGRCLDSLLRASDDHPFEIIVVANGCSDNTAQIARAHCVGVTVIELAEGSKPAALNAGEAACKGFPRLYVDADVVLTPGGVHAIAAELSSQEPMIATPRRSLQLSQASKLARWYYRTWEALQRGRGETIGTGVYGLDEAARRRFDTFPDRIGDDTFVHGLFRAHERRVVDHPVLVWPPQRLTEIVRVRSRVAIGNLTAIPGPGTRDRPPWLTQVRQLLGDPGAVAAMPIYVATTLLVRARARRRLRKGDLAWSRATRSS